VNVAIRAYVGFNGGGKTLCMIERDVLPALKKGRPVYSTVRIGPPEVEGLWLPGAYPLESWQQLDEIRDGTVILDEITSQFPARQSMSLPPQLVTRTQQLRKRDIKVSWTAPAWNRADKSLREVTGAVTVCRSFFAARYARDPANKIMRYDPDGVAFVPGFGVQEGKPKARVRYPGEWSPNRLFRFTTFSAMDFEEFSINASHKLKASRREWYWRTRHRAYISYSSLEEVALLSHLDDVGVCVVCGGSRQRKRCSCVRPERTAPAAPPGAEAPLA
jgi:hypothetical protein